jgi:hypothetical protein
VKRGEEASLDTSESRELAVSLVSLLENGCSL